MVCSPMYLKVFPFIVRQRFNGGFKLSKAQKVHIAILLLILLQISFSKIEGMKRVVVGWIALEGRIIFVSMGCISMCILT